MKNTLGIFFALVVFSCSAASQDTLRVMTYNLMGMKPGTDPASRIRYAIEYLKALDPDIIGLQEINETLSGGGADNQGKTIADSLSSYFGTTYNLYTGFTHLSWNSQYREYIGIITKYPVTATGYRSLTGGAFPRKVLFNRITTPLGQVNFYNTHVDYLNTSVRIQQVGQILSFIAETDSSNPPDVTLLTGDFNDTAGSAPIQLLSSNSTALQFIDTYRSENPLTPGHTVPSNAPTSRIDFVWQAYPWPIVTDSSFVVMNQPYPGYNFCSDHLGVMTLLVRGVCDVDDGSDRTTASTAELAPNYPNPFNPSTVVRYSLLEMSAITLKVYDLLGREVATLVDDVQSAGGHEVRWDASGMPGGIYVVRLQSVGGVQARRIMLIK